MLPAGSPVTPVSPGTGTPPRLRAGIEYCIDGDLRYLSHHDEMRMLTRSLIRARWPLVYSEGFNPQPRFSIPLPRRTGTAADRQLALVDLLPELEPSELHARLSGALPGAVQLQRVLFPLAGGTPKPLWAIFEVALDGTDASCGANAAAESDSPAGIGIETLAEACRTLIASASLIVKRVSDPDRPPRALDIRPFVESLEVQSGSLRMKLRFDGQLSARPVEVTNLLGLPAEQCEHRVRRVEVGWHHELAQAELSRAVEERLSLGQEEDDDENRDNALA